VSAIGRQENVIRFVRQPPREDMVEREADRRSDLVAIGVNAVLPHDVLNGSDDPVGRVDEGHVKVEADESHPASLGVTSTGASAQPRR
jgi:hypothetical protein